MLTFFRRKNSPERVAAERLYAAIVAQSRQPGFYAGFGVPDTVDGRFDSILLHAFVVMRRLGRGDRAARSLSQAVYDVMFVDMDRSVREMGIGDLSVKRHIRRMMKAFNGRVAAYEDGIDDLPRLCAALRRNLYGTVGDEMPLAVVQPVAAYVQASARAVMAQSPDSLAAGQIDWAALPQIQPRERAVS